MNLAETVSGANKTVNITGIEIGRFRLKSGITEEALRAAYATMIASHLALQTGWYAQHLVKLSDDVFLDIAFATSEDHAKAICASWQDQPVCNAFLALIEPVSMEFGTIVSSH